MWKGHTFTAADAPVGLRHGGDPEALEDWCRANTERYRVMYNCQQVVRQEGSIAVACGEDVIAEELEGHRLLHVSDNARAIARSLLVMTPEERAEVIAVVKELTDG